PAGMSRLGGNLFAATEASGDIQTGNPGENGTGTLLSGYIEGSNVEVVEEMTRMITAQRAYEINSKAIQTADDMLGIVNNLKR
ncbi:flagellar hook-basal body complex protein, partial [bacterium]